MNQLREYNLYVPPVRKDQLIKIIEFPKEESSLKKKFRFDIKKCFKLTILIIGVIITAIMCQFVWQFVSESIFAGLWLCICFFAGLIWYFIFYWNYGI